LKELYSLQKGEFNIALVAILGVLVFGILKGVLIAALFSILVLIVRSKNPHVAILGQIPGTDVFSDIERNPTNTEIPGLKILRIESNLLYFNAEFVEHQILILSNSPEVHTVILDLSSCPFVDITGGKTLVKINEELKSQNKELKIVGALAEVRDILRKLHLEEEIGKISRRDTIKDAVQRVMK
ncbi:MAG: STAS domain-containing protein, partial [Algoriphagus sp.]|nr:STAS domain-containing protein [Algoriphagus sp.]